MGRKSVATDADGKPLPDGKTQSIRRIYILKLKKLLGLTVGKKGKL